MQDDRLKRPVMTYAEDSQLWISLADQFEARLPLRQLQWQQPANERAVANVGSSRTIAALNVDIKPFSTDLLPKFSPGGFSHNNVFLHLFLVGCDDIEQYRNSVKRRLQDWMSAVGSKKSQEWLVVYVAGPEATKRTIFNVGGNVIDKLRSDFGLKKERLVLLRPAASDPKEAEMWNELFTRMKEWLMAAIAQQVSQYDEDARRLEQQRLMPGWNYCQYFAMKEALAFTYELATLYDEALLHYDELEATFFQTLAEQGAPWFKTFGGLQPGDDCADVLHLDRKPYRDLIIQNSISIFDFRVYLFGRQCILLLLQKLPDVLLKRAHAFATSFSKTLLEYQVSLFPLFRESWVYSFAMYIVRECDAAIQNMSIEASRRSQYDLINAELLQMARIQLDYLGAFHHLFVNPLYAQYIYSLQVAPSNGQQQTEGPKITNAELVQALSSKESFDVLYTRLSNETAKLFKENQRPRMANMIQCDLAFLLFTRGQFDKAAQIWDQIAFKYSDDGWHTIEALQLERFAACCRILHLHDKLAACCLYLVSHPSLLTLKTCDEYLDELKVTSQLMDSILVRRNLSIFNVKVTSIVTPVSEMDNIVVNIDIYSTLSREINVDIIELKLESLDGRAMLPLAEILCIKPGSNAIQLSCQKSTSPGLYSPLSLRISISKVEINYDLPSNGSKNAVRIAESSAPIYIGASLPSTCIHGKSYGSVTFHISALKTAISSSRLSISTLANSNIVLPPEITFTVSNRTDKSQETPTLVILQPLDGRICLPDLSLNENASFTLEYPIIQEAKNNEVKFKASLTFLDSSGAKRSYAPIVRVSPHPIFSFQHNLVFTNHDSVLVCIDVKAKEGFVGRIVNIRFISDNKEIEPVVPVSDSILVSNNHLSSVFKLGKGQSFGEGSKRGCTLKIKYRSLSEEIECYILSRLESVLQTNNLTKYTDFLTSYVKRSMLPLIDPFEYAAFRTIDYQKFDPAGLQPFLLFEDEASRHKVLGVVDQFWNDVLNTDMNTILLEIQKTSINHSWMYYEFQVTTPRFVVETKLIPVPHHVNIGEPFPCEIKIKTSAWECEHDSVNALYILDIDTDCFTLCGKKRQLFKLQKNKESEFIIHLCGIQAGHVLLPTIKIEILGYTSEDVGVRYLSAGAQMPILTPLKTSRLFVPFSDAIPVEASTTIR